MSTTTMDAVYVWVDGSAPGFQEDLFHQTQALGEDAGVHDVSPSRFRDNGELRYSLRSLARHAPWVRRVFVVTNGQVPMWLDRAHPQITVVSHAELFPNGEDLPTFNSNAIELHLHRIPGVARRFLYFNDDVFVGRPTRPEDFVRDSGRPRLVFMPEVNARRPGATRRSPATSSTSAVRLGVVRR